MNSPDRPDGLLRAAAARKPEKLALESAGDSLTYGELDAAADRVAAALADLGVEVGDRVGIRLEKGIEAIVGLYGAMRAGAAYVPLDPGAPPQRPPYIPTDREIAALIPDPQQIPALRGLDPPAPPRGIASGPPPPAGFLG